MLLARVVGTVVATRKDSRLDGKKLLIVKPIDPSGKDESGYLIAVDTVGAGFREKVIVVSGSSARMASGCKDCPVDTAIVGIVDSVEVSPQELGEACVAGTRWLSRSLHWRQTSRRNSKAMQIGRIIGNVVCTIKNDPLEGKKLLVVQPLDKNGSNHGKPLVAIDAVGAGVGETIYWCRGREASMPWYPDQEVPTEATIVGIIDAIDLGQPMLIGKVIGNVVATRKHVSHENQKILYVQILNLDGSGRSNPILALDAVDAGVGDRVLVTQEGWSAMTSVGKPFSPIDMAVVGVIDSVELAP